MTGKRRTMDKLGMTGHVLRSAGVLVVTLAVAGPLRAQNWKDFSPKERYDALQNYQRHQQLPEERQKDVEQGYERWRKMPPDERARVRKNYDRLQRLPPKEREQFDRKYEKWRQQHDQPPQ